MYFLFQTKNARSVCFISSRKTHFAQWAGADLLALAVQRSLAIRSSAKIGLLDFSLGGGPKVVGSIPLVSIPL